MEIWTRFDYNENKLERKKNRLFYHLRPLRTFQLQLYR